MIDDFEYNPRDYIENFMAGIKPIPSDVKEMYKDTEFICGECGGLVIPQTMETGICFHCKTESNLNDLEYEINNNE